jgi:hypothetical protein
LGAGAKGDGAKRLHHLYVVLKAIARSHSDGTHKEEKTRKRR